MLAAPTFRSPMNAQSLPNDEPLKALQAMSALHSSCWRICRRITDDTLALQALTVGLQEHNITPPTDDTAIELLQRYRAAVTDSSIAEDLEFERFGIEQDIQSLEAELRMMDAFGQLSDASPLPVAGLSAAPFLCHLYPNNETVLLYPSSKSKKPHTWWPELADKCRITHLWFRPLPLKDPYDDPPNLKSESVGAWSLACAVFSSAEVKMLTPAIIAGDLPIRSIVGLSTGRASIVFSIDAETKEEWAEQCRALRKRLDDLGVKVAPFRYDWLAHLPSEAYGNKLVFLAP